MFLTSFTEFCEKEVVNCRDGKILGSPYNLKFDTDSGMVCSFFVRENGLFCLPSKNDSIEIPWDHIDKIGHDIILVHLEHYPEPPARREKKKSGKEKDPC